MRRIHFCGLKVEKVLLMLFLDSLKHWLGWSQSLKSNTIFFPFLILTAVLLYLKKREEDVACDVFMWFCFFMGSNICYLRRIFSVILWEI